MRVSKHGAALAFETGACNAVCYGGGLRARPPQAEGGTNVNIMILNLRQIIARKDVLAGLLFSVIALIGLYVSRDYPIGTALRMGTGYVPRLLCWLLLGLGMLVAAQGLRSVEAQRVPFGGGSAWRPVIFVTVSLVLFGLTSSGWGL